MSDDDRVLIPVVCWRSAVTTTRTRWRRGCFAVITTLVALWFLGGAVSQVVQPSVAQASAGRWSLFGRVAQKYRWSVRVSPDRHVGRSRPCLSVEVMPLKRASPMEFGEGDESCRRPVALFPNLVSIVDELGKPTVTVVGMLFAPSATSVSLYFSGGMKPRTVRLKRMGGNSGSRVGATAFSYGAIAFAGQSCIDRFISRSASGQIVDDGGRMHCRG